MQRRRRHRPGRSPHFRSFQLHLGRSDLQRRDILVVSGQEHVTIAFDQSEIPRALRAAEPRFGRGQVQFVAAPLHVGVARQRQLHPERQGRPRLPGAVPLVSGDQAKARTRLPWSRGLLQRKLHAGTCALVVCLGGDLDAYGRAGQLGDFGPKIRPGALQVTSGGQQIWRGAARFFAQFQEVKREADGSEILP